MIYNFQRTLQTMLFAIGVMTSLITLLFASAGFLYKNSCESSAAQMRLLKSQAEIIAGDLAQTEPQTLPSRAKQMLGILAKQPSLTAGKVTSAEQITLASFNNLHSNEPVLLAENNDFQVIEPIRLPSGAPAGEVWLLASQPQREFTAREFWNLLAGILAASLLVMIAFSHLQMRAVKLPFPAWMAGITSPSPAPTLQDPLPPIYSQLPLEDEDFRVIVEEFIVRLNGKMQQMRDCFEAGNWPELKQLAHWLKGAGGSAGFPALTTIAAELEDVLAAGDLPAIIKTMATLEATHARIAMPALAHA